MGDTIILPLVDVSFGVGAGAFAEEKKNNGGGAMGGKISPSAVLVISGGVTKLVNIKNQDGLTKVLDMVPDFLNKFTEGKKESEVVIHTEEKKEEKTEDKGEQSMSRVCGLFLFAFGMGLFIALIFPKTLFMVVVAALCLLIGYNLFCSCHF